MKKNFSVVIVTFHSEEIIEKTIKELNDLDVVIVECSNNANLKEKILSKYDNVNFILSSKNLGYSAGNNLVIKLTKYDDVLIINPDVILNEENIKNLINYMNNIDGYGILCPNLKTEVCKNFSKKNNYLPTIINWEAIGQGLVGGCAFLLNKKILNDEIYFDEKIFMYKEDTDMIKRANDKKIDVYYLPNCGITHIGSSSHNKKIDFEVVISRQFHWPYGNVYFYIKHFGYFFAMKKWGMKFISAIFKTIFFALLLNKKYKKYLSRFLGISSALFKIKAWYRLKVKS